MGLRQSTAGGSKVVKAAAVSLTETINKTEPTVPRTITSVKPHIPLIKFPQRQKVPKWSPSSWTGPTIVQPTPSTQFQPPVAPSKTKPVGSTPRGSGIDYEDLPERFRRRPISQEEIEYIERGGPW